MICSTLGPFTPEEGSRLLRAVCQRCHRRRDCPYFCDHAHVEALCSATRQGHAVAQQLTAAAEQLLRTISRADDLNCLLCANEALERTLSDALRSELTFIKNFPFQ